MSDRKVISELVRKLGGHEAVAIVLRCNSESVRQWPHKGIPWKWRYSVRRIARRRKIKLSPAEWEVLSLEPAEADAS